MQHPAYAPQPQQLFFNPANGTYFSMVPQQRYSMTSMQPAHSPMMSPAFVQNQHTHTVPGANPPFLAPPPAYNLYMQQRLAPSPVPSYLSPASPTIRYPDLVPSPTYTPISMSPPTQDHIPLVTIPSTSSLPAESIIETDAFDNVRCQRCNKFFKHAENRSSSNSQFPCSYHPGRFAAIKLAFVRVEQWSCCNADEKAAEGCCHGFHEEDMKTSAILARFPKHSTKEEVPQPVELTEEAIVEPVKPLQNMQLINLDGLAPTMEDSPLDGEDSDLPEQSTDGKEEKKKDEGPKYVKDTDGFVIIKHPVQPNDTLSGICIYYKTEANDVLKRNNLMNDCIFVRKFLKIRTRFPDRVKDLKPINQKDLRKNLITRWVLIFKTTPNEAAFYLEDNDWDFTRAKEAFKDDIRWERNNSHKTFSSVYFDK